MKTVWISTTIKKKYMDKILSGDKKFELKGDIIYWRQRLDKLIGKKNVTINFLCGQKSYKFKVKNITKIEHPFEDTVEIDGIFYSGYYEIGIGERLVM